jgi:hypothetical protein
VPKSYEPRLRMLPGLTNTHIDAVRKVYSLYKILITFGVEQRFYTNLPFFLDQGFLRISL